MNRTEPNGKLIFHKDRRCALTRLGFLLAKVPPDRLMQSLIRAVRSKCRISSQIVSSSSIGSVFESSYGGSLFKTRREFGSGARNFNALFLASKPVQDGLAMHGCGAQLSFFSGSHGVASLRCLTTASNPVESVSCDSTAPETAVPTRIKFKRPDKTARHIMQILDKEAVEEVKGQREIPDIKPGYTIQLKLEVPENKRRTMTLKGTVIARRNAGLNTTFRLRRLVAGVGVESLLLLYSPNIKEIKVLTKTKVRRAKLYYLRKKMNAFRK